MEKVIVFATGKNSEHVFSSIKAGQNEIVAVVDNDKLKWGSDYCGYKIESPQVIFEREYDRILISSTLFYDEIYTQLVKKLHVPKMKIVDYSFYSRKNLLKYYEENRQYISSDMLKPINYIESHNNLEVFNYSFKEKYAEYNVRVEFDEESGMFFTYINDKKCFLKKAINTYEKALRYVKALCIEQDEKSPHKYTDDIFNVKSGDVVLDAGVAEGNFSLKVIDKVKHIYLIEADSEWVEALEYTFAPYKDKVTIINKFLTNKQGEDNITVDELFSNADIDFVKMDIEGAELDAVNGARSTLRKSRNLKLAICVYHNFEDEKNIAQILRDCQYSVSTTAGYMVFMDSDIEPKRLVHGIIRAERTM